MATQRKVEFQGTFNIQEILSAVDALQNRLNRIQLDDSSARRFERTFADLKKRAQEIDAEIKNEISSGKVYLQAPAGLNVLIHFPTRKIIETFEDAVGGSGSASTVQGLVNSLTLRIP